MRKYFIIISLITFHHYILASNQRKLIAEHAELETLSDEFTFTEGPASDTLGNVYFTDIPNNRIYKYSTDGNLKVFIDSVPGNGLAFDEYENLVICGNNGGRNIFMVNLESKERKVLADKYEGNAFNSPNDLWIDNKNGIYFTDPRYGNRENMEMETEQVYYLTPDRKKVIRVSDDLEKPNGVYGIQNGKKLLIADHSAGKVYIYNIKKDGTLSGKKILIDNEKVDGMTVDELENIYICSDHVKIYNKKGFLIEVIKTPESPTNVCFGGKDFKTLYITERKKVYKLKMNVKGARY